MRLPIWTSFFLIAWTALGQEQEQVLPPQRLREDLLILHQTLKQFHPGYNRHVPVATLDSMFNMLRSGINKPMTQMEFFRLAATGVAGLRCGHTRLQLSPASEEALHASGKFFPLASMIADKKLVVRLTGQGLREVTSINSVPIDKIMELINARFPVDGFAASAKYDYLEDFALYYAKYFDHTPDSFEIGVKGKAGQPEEMLSIPAVDYARASALRFFSQAPGANPISFKVKGGVGYLDVKTFSSSAYTSKGIYYHKFLEQTFRTLNGGGVANLIIDIRGNGGGDDEYGAVLFGYLTRKPFAYFKRVATKENDRFVAVKHPCLNIQPRETQAYTGQVFLLVDGKTFSTAADVASVFMSHSRGLVVGRETGGGYEGNTSGASKRANLPNTGHTIVIPLWYYENAVRPPLKTHRGVIPDVIVDRTFKSLEEGRDPVLEYVLGKM